MDLILYLSYVAEGTSVKGLSSNLITVIRKFIHQVMRFARSKLLNQKLDED